MKVVDFATIQARHAERTVTIIDALPDTLEAGDYVRCGDKRFQVMGIEMRAHGRSHANGQSAGLILDGENALPEVGSELTREEPRPRITPELNATLNAALETPDAPPSAVPPSAPTQPSAVNGDEDEGDGETHCHCGWEMPDEALPVMEANLPEDPHDLTEQHAIPGALVVFFCPQCGCGHTLKVGGALN